MFSASQTTLYRLDAEAENWPWVIFCPNYKDGMAEGWEHHLEDSRELAEGKSRKGRQR